jgi:hypothetical protein
MLMTPDSPPPMQSSSLNFTILRVAVLCNAFCMHTALATGIGGCACRNSSSSHAHLASPHLGFAKEDALCHHGVVLDALQLVRYIAGILLGDIKVSRTSLRCRVRGDVRALGVCLEHSSSAPSSCVAAHAEKAPLAEQTIQTQTRPT